MVRRVKHPTLHESGRAIVATYSSMLNFQCTEAHCMTATEQRCGSTDHHSLNDNGLIETYLETKSVFRNASMMQAIYRQWSCGNPVCCATQFDLRRWTCREPIYLY